MFCFSLSLLISYTYVKNTIRIAFIEKKEKYPIFICLILKLSKILELTENIRDFVQKNLKTVYKSFL